MEDDICQASPCMSTYISFLRNVDIYYIRVDVDIMLICRHRRVICICRHKRADVDIYCIWPDVDIMLLCDVSELPHYVDIKVKCRHIPVSNKSCVFPSEHIVKNVDIYPPLAICRHKYIGFFIMSTYAFWFLRCRHNYSRCRHNCTWCRHIGPMSG